MHLSDRQVRIVNAFLRDAALETPAEPPSARTVVLTHIRRQLRDELARRTDAPLLDEELIRLLNRIQFPERAARADAMSTSRAAAELIESMGNGSDTQNGGAAGHNGHAPSAVLAPPVPYRLATAVRAAPLRTGAGDSDANLRRSRQLPSGPLASSERVWLGACIALAEMLHVQVSHVRIAAFGLGLLMGPVAVVFYLALYAWFYLGEHGDGAPRVNRLELLRAMASAAGVLVFMGATLAVAVGLVGAVHTMAIGYPPADDEWSSFANGAHRLLTFAAAVLLPFAALRGLPVAPPWDLLLPRLLQAALSAVAALLALAFSSYLTGALLSAVQDWPA